MEPGSQMRHPSDEGGSHNLFLWGQSLYITASLLAEGLVHVNELDLIRRYLPSYNRPRKMGGRYSAFQVIIYLLSALLLSRLSSECIEVVSCSNYEVNLFDLKNKYWINELLLKSARIVRILF
jgi:hypothetical protein